MARLAAQSMGFPEPKFGFTFVRPHRRGDGEVGVTRNVGVAHKKIICRGLQTVAQAFVDPNQ